MTSNGAAIDLTTATEVKFLFQKGIAEALSRTAVIDSPATAGIASYTFVAGDWAEDEFEAGAYDFEAQVTFTGGAVLTVPTGGHATVNVIRDLGD
jgi:hypothetical protein